MFAKINGPNNYDVVSKFRVQSYPSFVIIEPSGDGSTWKQFTNYQRTYATMKTWILAFAGTRIKSGFAPKETTMVPQASSQGSSKAVESLLLKVEKKTNDNT